ncbi:uncharacterized protein BDR25DRAFT_359449 [Lindgomyces ingoldianus]|uniref:Uncharacterized protein n=1 Tax=Lindgomyces ingoldianus TaxID=673940 RepID=A0ACB6QHZ5_9PLEO|nr:uncharacterized protein BDR25DRAFT_359449 [Lindgomyces ingoldianus]KAF2466554.1 hypothetical protein BDR25DRAFT_359449 [Lindgomyces ingoldianus]
MLSFDRGPTLPRPGWPWIRLQTLATCNVPASVSAAVFWFQFRHANSNIMTNQLTYHRHNYIPCCGHIKPAASNRDHQYINPLHS